MKEISDILAAWRDWPDAALATVVRVEGSAYRRPGARMLIAGDGRTIGSVSGGCIERDVIWRAGAARDAGEALRVRYDSVSEEEAGPGGAVGCGGTIDILIEPADHALRPLEWLWSRRRRGAIATVIARQNSPVKIGSRLAVDEETEMDGAFGQWAVEARSALQSGASRHVRRETGDGWVDLYVEVLEPPPELFVFGAGGDALPLAALGRSLGWRVTVIDLRSGPAAAERRFDADAVLRLSMADLAQLDIPAGGMAVVMNHNWKHDLAVLRRLSQMPLKYLGVLGPRRRSERLLERLGVIPDEQTRFPVGLDIGAETPQEVALSIVAEITMVLRGGGGGALRDKAGPIHFPAEEPCPTAAL